MRIALEKRRLDQLERHLAVFSQVNLFTGKINNPELVEKTSQLIAEKKGQENALLH